MRLVSWARVDQHPYWWYLHLFCVMFLSDHIKVEAKVGVNGLQLTSP